MDTKLRREECEGCCKQIYQHNKFVLCHKCDKIAHYNCSLKAFKYDQIKDKWICWDCYSNKPKKYNPFDSIFFNKYLVDDANASEEITQIKNIMEQCQLLRPNQIHKVIADKSKHSLSFLFNNIDGFSSNFDTFHAELGKIKHKLNIIAFAETNIDETHKKLYRIAGYDTIFQSKIKGKNKGSGLGIYLDENLASNKINKCCKLTEDIESLFIRIDNISKPLTFGIIYRPPNGNIKNFFSQLENIISNLPDSNSVISGDFNINLLADDKNWILKNFENIVYGNCYMPLISLATHHKPGCNPSCIDNILVNSYDNVFLSGVLELNISHHSPVICFINDVIDHETTEKKLSLPKYDYSETNLIKFNNKLCYELKNSAFSHNENGFNDFIKCINKNIDECFITEPTMINSKRNRLVNPWITNGLINSINHNQFLYRTWKKSTKNNADKPYSETLYVKYKEFRKYLKYLINSAKKLYYSEKFDRAYGNSKKTWEIINELRGKQNSKIKPSFQINGTLIKDRRTIANEFNKYFASIAHNMNETLKDTKFDGIPIQEIPNFSTYITNNVSDSIFLNDCTYDEISSIIKDFNNNKSSDISIKVLKSCSNIISPYLSRFYNKFMMDGIFPYILKVGNITPVYKKGDRQLIENYRPVSTLPCFSKIFEKIIYSRLYDFIKSKNILYRNQYGFRSKHSTSNAINHSIDQIISGLENNHHVIGIFIDLSKAFDTICHSKLLTKLKKYGIRGSPLELIKSFMSPRKQIVNLNGTKSEEQLAQYGVPQGSVLGPLLFLLYINDIVNSSPLGHLVLFADDTSIFVTAPTEKEVYTKANTILHHINLYLLSNQLHINLAKSVYIHFKPKLSNDNRKTCARTRPHEDYYSVRINGTKLFKTDKVRFLGVIVDEQLNWENHIEYLEEKLNSSIIVIKRIKKFIPQAHYKKLYHSLFETHLTYGITAWGNASKSKLKVLFTIQKRCLRLLFGEKLNFDHKEFYETCARARSYQEHKKPRDFELEHTKPLFNRYKLLNIFNLYKQFTFLETFKILKYKYPLSFTDKLKLKKIKAHSKLILEPNDYKLSSSRRHFIFSSISLWNKIQQKVFTTPSLDLELNIVIPGSCKNSDLSTHLNVAKKRVKMHLIEIQNNGNSLHWLPSNL